MEYGGDCGINSFVYGFDASAGEYRIVTVASNRKMIKQDGNVWKISQVGAKLVGLCRDGRLFEIGY